MISNDQKDTKIYNSSSTQVDLKTKIFFYFLFSQLSVVRKQENITEKTQSVFESF